MTGFRTIQSEIARQRALQTGQEMEAIRPIDITSESERRRNQDIATALGVSIESVETARANGDERILMQAVAQVRQSADATAVADQAYEEGLPEDQAAEAVGETLEAQADLSTGDFLLNQALLLGDPSISNAGSRYVANLETWDRLMADAFDEANERGFFRRALNWVDINILRGMTIGAFEDVSLRSNREGEEIRRAFLSMRPDEFREWATEYISERRQEGIFSRGSVDNLYAIAEDQTYRGDNPRALGYGILSVLDVAEIGAVTALTARGIGRIRRNQREVQNVLEDLSQARRSVDTEAVAVGEAEAGATLGRQASDNTVITDPVLAGRAGPATHDATTGPSARPSLAAVESSSRRTRTLDKFEEINRRGFLGELVSPDQVRQLADEVADRISRNISDGSVNIRRVVDEGSDDYVVRMRIGNPNTGSAFRTKAHAEQIAAMDPSFTVVRRENGRGWFVDTERRLDISGIGDEAEILGRTNFIMDTIGNVFEPSTVRLGDRLGAKIMQAEAGQSLLKELVQPIERNIRKLKGKEQRNITDFFEQLRDGELSHLRSHPTPSDFKAHYQLRYGITPSDRVMNAYSSLVELSDTTWNILASARLKRVVAESGEVIELGDGLTGIGYRVSNVPEDDLILDIATNRSRQPSDIKDKEIVYRLTDPFLDHIYVTNVRSSRVPEKVDVMPYNVGGPRDNPDLRWFVGSSRSTTLASGKEVNLTFRTLFGSFGEKQARSGVRQVNTITTRVKELMDAQGVRKVDELILSAADEAELDELILRNNSWNRTVGSFQDLKILAAKYDLDFDQQFFVRARDSRVSDTDAGQDFSLRGQTFGELVGTRVNMRRNDTVPLEYGGRPAVNNSPIQAIADQFSSVGFGYANRAATHDALVGWVKRAEQTRAVTFDPNIPRNDFLNRFLTAQVDTGGEYAGIGSRLREQQRIIGTRLGQPTFSSRIWENFTKTATEAIFSGTGIKLDLTKTDPASRLLQVGFYSKFGFFNPDQFVLQALHSSVILAVSPRQGSKALGLSLPVQMLASLPDNASIALGIRRMAKGMNIDEQELTDIVRYVRESGRNIIDTQITELQMPNTVSAAGTAAGKVANSVGRALDASTLFFQAGEKASRTVGMVTAFLEHRAKRPSIDPFSPEGQRWIMNREQDLTFRMTTSSKAAWQQGILRVPTQWLSYSMTALQNIVIGRRFTAGERIRMFTALAPVYGLTGLGIGHMAGYITQKMGFDPNDPESVRIHNRIKYGLLDALLTELVGTETAYAERVAALPAGRDFVRDLFTESFVTTVFGPSGEIGQDIVSGISNMITMSNEDNWVVFSEEARNTLRNISTYDKWVKIMELIDTGDYLSRTHRAAVTNVPEEDRMAWAGAIAFGATPAPVVNYYDYQEMYYRESDSVNGVRDEVLRRARAALQMVQSSDPDQVQEGIELYNRTRDLLYMSPLSNELKLSVERQMMTSADIPDIMRSAIRLGLEYDAQLLEQQR